MNVAGNSKGISTTARSVLVSDGKYLMINACQIKQECQSMYSGLLYGKKKIIKHARNGAR